MLLCGFCLVVLVVGGLLFWLFFWLDAAFFVSHFMFHCFTICTIPGPLLSAAKASLRAKKMSSVSVWVWDFHGRFEVERGQLTCEALHFHVRRLAWFELCLHEKFSKSGFRFW